MSEKKGLEWKDFPSTTYDQWMNETVRLLKGADFNKRLIKETYDGIKVSPLYHQENGSEVAGRPIRFFKESFKKVQEFHASGEETIKEVSLALSNGIDEVNVKSLDLTKNILNRFDIKKHRISFDENLITEENLVNLKNLLEQKGYSTKALAGNLGLDPLDVSFKKSEGHQQGINDLKKIVPFAMDEFPQMGTLMVRGNTYYDAGASDTLEMAVAMSKGIFYVKTLLETGLSLENIFKHMSFSLALSPELFPSIAKLRAFRLNMQQIFEAFGGKGIVPLWLHVKSSERTMTQMDPWVNILRGTVVAFSGAVGGADSITIIPFDERIKTPDSLSYRVARNTGLILDEESHLGFVNDPLAGSYAVESLTLEMGKTSWNLMQKIEEEGGIVNYVSSGKLKEEISKTQKQKEKNIVKRKDAITGVSEFPFLNEDLSHLSENENDSSAFAVKYNGLPFEKLRIKSNDHLKSKGIRPTVVMATLGPIAKHVGRSTFTQNFFATGGIDAVQVEGEKSVSEISKVLNDHKTSVVCLSAPDDLYLEKGLDLVTKLRSAGAKYVVLAGKVTDELKPLEVNTSLSMGCDVLEVLNNVWAQF